MTRLLTIAIFLFAHLSVHQTPGLAQEIDPAPPYDMAEIEAYSLFYESYNNDDYQMARTYGEWMLEAVPTDIEGHDGFSLETQFRRMINVYAGLAEQEFDPSEQSILYDKAIWVFERLSEVFDSEEIDLFEWTIREGRFYQEHNQNLDNGIQAAYESYESAYDMDPERFAGESDGYYAGILLHHYVSEGDTETALAMIEIIEPYASAELVNSIEEARNQLYDDPEDRAEYLEGRLAEGQADDQEAVLSELATLYEELGFRERALKTAERLYELNPNFENTRTLGDLILSDADYQRAINYFEEAIEQSPGETERAGIARQISEAYQNMDDLQSARDYARIAIDANPYDGEAYLIISSIYASAISECTSGRDMKRSDRTVYWLVLDYLDQAIEADPSVATTAERRMESYEAVMPNTEDKFFMDWVVGEPFRIDGEVGDCYAWIDEETTVR